jgi:hypothetical protein
MDGTSMPSCWKNEERAILRGLGASKWFFLVMSPRSAASEYVKDEVAWAIEERPKNFLPPLIENSDPRDFQPSQPRMLGVEMVKPRVLVIPRRPDQRRSVWAATIALPMCKSRAASPSVPTL